MAHYAKLDENNIVTEVIVISDEDENGTEANGIAFCRELFSDPTGVYKKTSFNTREGVHLLDGTPLRINFAQEGYYYDEDLDGFIPFKDRPDDISTFNSWSINTTTGLWEAPIAYPSDGRPTEGMTPEEIDELSIYSWDEAAYQADTADPKTQGWVPNIEE